MKNHPSQHQRQLVRPLRLVAIAVTWHKRDCRKRIHVWFWWLCPAESYSVKYQPGCCVLPKVCSRGEADNSVRKLSPDLWKIHCHCHFTWGSIVKNQNLPDIQTLIRLWSTLWCHHPSWRENCEVVAHRYAIFGSLNIILSTSAPPQFEFPRRVEIYLTSGLLQFGSPSEALAPAKWNKDKLTLFSEKNNDVWVFLTFGQSSAGGGGTDWWFQTTTILVRDSTSPRVWITWAVRFVSILRTSFLHKLGIGNCDKNPSKLSLVTKILQKVWWRI